jgi:hypothetical protein
MLQQAGRLRGAIPSNVLNEQHVRDTRMHALYDASLTSQQGPLAALSSTAELEPRTYPRATRTCCRECCAPRANAARRARPPNRLAETAIPVRPCHRSGRLLVHLRPCTRRARCEFRAATRCSCSFCPEGRLSLASWKGVRRMGPRRPGIRRLLPSKPSRRRWPVLIPRCRVRGGDHTVTSSLDADTSSRAGTIPQLPLSPDLVGLDRSCCAGGRHSVRIGNPPINRAGRLDQHTHYTHARGGTTTRRCVADADGVGSAPRRPHSLPRTRGAAVNPVRAEAATQMTDSTVTTESLCLS